jgi:hypothetical protein
MLCPKLCSLYIIMHICNCLLAGRLIQIAIQSSKLIVSVFSVRYRFYLLQVRNIGQLIIEKQNRAKHLFNDSSRAKKSLADFFNCLSFLFNQFLLMFHLRLRINLSLNFPKYLTFILLKI